MSVLSDYLAETEDYRRIAEHLRLDQQTALPLAAMPDRADQVVLLDRVLRERTASPELEMLLNHAKSVGDDSPLLDLVERDMVREKKMPTALLGKWTQASASGFPVWRQARADNDWNSLAPVLDKLVDLNLEIAEAIGYEEHPMDAMLSMYEQGPTTSTIQRLYDAIAPTLLRIQEVRPDEGSAEASDERLSPSQLRALVRGIGDAMGFEWDRGSIAIAPHPFMSPAGPNDVRVTVRDDVSLPSLVQATVHELGHAIYEQGIPQELWGSPAGRGIFTFHESQAKFWENIVGRSQAFCALVARIARETLGEVPASLTEEALHRGFLRPRPTTIRIESDEVGFNLHLMIRWEIEMALLERRIVAKDVPELWNSLSEKYLGVIPETNRVGCLQDPHWIMRHFGGYPCYLLGNVASAHMGESLEREGISLDDACASGSLVEARDWLRANVHVHGRLYPIEETLTKATGSGFTPEAYQRHLVARYEN